MLCTNISDDLINFGKEPIENKKADGSQFAKNYMDVESNGVFSPNSKHFFRRRGLFCLNNFWKNTLKKMADSSHVIIVWFNFFVGLTWEYLEGILLMF